MLPTLIYKVIKAVKWKHKTSIMLSTYTVSKTWHELHRTVLLNRKKQNRAVISVNSYYSCRDSLQIRPTRGPDGQGTV